MGVESNGVICGVVQVGRPVSRVLDDGKHLRLFVYALMEQRTLVHFFIPEQQGLPKN